MATKLLLSAGACFTADEVFDKCALHPSNCSSDAPVYHSSHWLTQNDKDEISRQCSDQQSIRDLKNVGLCNGQADRYICTSHKTACRFASVFEPNTDFCNLVHDFYTENEFLHSHYGFCRYRGEEEDKDDFCSWQFSECGGNQEIYQWNAADPFFANNNPDCYCDDVRIGACVDSNNNLFCAVSSEVCETDPGFTYLKVLELESQLSTACNLCDTLSETDLNTPRGSPTIAMKASNEMNTKSDIGKIVGISVGAAVGAIFIIVGGVIVFRRMRKSKEVNSPDFDEKSLNSVL